MGDKRQSGSVGWKGDIVDGGGREEDGPGLRCVESVFGVSGYARELPRGGTDLSSREIMLVFPHPVFKSVIATLCLLEVAFSLPDGPTIAANCPCSI